MTHPWPSHEEPDYREGPYLTPPTHELVACTNWTVDQEIRDSALQAACRLWQGSHPMSAAEMDLTRHRIVSLVDYFVELIKTGEVPRG